MEEKWGREEKNIKGTKREVSGKKREMVSKNIKTFFCWCNLLAYYSRILNKISDN